MLPYSFMAGMRWLALACVTAAFAAGPSEEAPKAPSPADRLAGEVLAATDREARRRTLGDHPEVPPIDLCNALSARGLASYETGDRSAALAAFETEMAIAEELSLDRPLADAVYRASVVRESRGELAVAASLAARAEALYQKVGSQSGLARVWNSRGLSARRLARFDEAESYFRRSLDAFRASGESAHVSAVLGNLGLVCLNRGDFACALDAEQRSLEVDPRNSYAVHNIAAIHENQGDDALALDGYLRAAALDHEDGDAVHEATTLVEAGRMMMHLGQEPQAAQSFATARGILEKAETPAELGELEYALGESHLRAGRAADALRHFQAAVALQEKVDLLRLTDTLVALSHAQLAAHEAGAALESAQRSLEILRQYDSIGGMSHAWVAIGEAQEALGRTDDAAAAYARAIEAIETWRRRLAGDESSRERFFEGWLKPYHRLLAFAAAAERVDEAFTFAERARARVLVEVLQHGRRIGVRLLTPEEREREAAAELAVRTLEIQREAGGDVSGGGPAGIGERLDAARRDLAAVRTALVNAHAELRLARGEAAIVSPQDLAPVLADGSAAIAFTVTEDATYAFVLTADPRGAARPPTVRVRVTRLATGAKAWRERIEAFRAALAARDLDVGREACRLYADLLGPLRAGMAGRRRLYLVPDAALWELPFAALQPSPGRYLIEDASLSLAPSLTALAAWRARPRPAPTAYTYEMLAVGESDFGKTLPRLPAAIRQARAVAALYGSTARTLVGSDATEARVKGEAARARLLHFASHGVFEPASPLYSALILAPEPAAGADNGRLEAREILDLELPADLAVLAACETARGRIGAGEGVIGLSWAFSVAGVRNTVVSLWNVDAASASGLVLAFHRRVRGGADYAEALRDAALAMRRDPRTRHPFYWAPFVLIGGGRSAQGLSQELDE